MEEGHLHFKNTVGVPKVSRESTENRVKDAAETKVRSTYKSTHIEKELACL